MNQSKEIVAPVSLSERIRAHLAIARFDHWTKNVFVLPGIVIAASVVHPGLDMTLAWRVLIGLFVTGLIASSNYVINEIMDAPFDRLHPTKRLRPAARGLVHEKLGYAQWILLMIGGLALATILGRLFLLTMVGLWLMGCIYNIPPLRTKDVQYLDVTTEAINNPLRMLAGWYIITDVVVPPLSLLISYWMVGCYFMALKRFSEYRELKSAELAGSYRKSFQYYSERSLLVSVLFYASTGMLFFGAFIMRYRIELMLAFPLVAVVMAIYCNLAFDDNSCVQHPEKLHKQSSLMVAVTLCAALLITLMFIDVPLMNELFAPSIPPQRW